MQFRRRSALLLVILWSGFWPLLAACGFITASNSASAPLPGQTSPATSLLTPAATATPDSQPVIDVAMQQRIAEILTPSPRLDLTDPAAIDREAGPIFTSVPFPAPTMAPAGDFKAAHYISGFACTGSMRPTIDCGDEGVFLKPPFPEPLMVGDVISFSQDTGCTRYHTRPISKAHRIIAIEAKEGVPLYTTRGDATLNPDPCKVTLDQIDGKLVEIRKGVRPHEVIDTSEYEFAKARVNLLQAEYREKKEVLDSQQKSYDAQEEEYSFLVSRYETGQVSYEEANEFHQELEERRLALNQLKNELNSLGEKINAAIDEVDRLYQELFIR